VTVDEMYLAIAPVPTSLLPCWVQTPLLRVKTPAAPMSSLSPMPPMVPPVTQYRAISKRRGQVSERWTLSRQNPSRQFAASADSLSDGD
jgi:hypothetical protein